jgi:cytochrome c-type biogenesis protein CcmH
MSFVRCTLAGLLAATMVVSYANAPPDEARYQALIDELRCLVCQNQTIAESNAPLAADLREQVRKQMAEGKTDREIIEYVTARYGDFVLYRPPFKARTWLLWLGPFALLLTVAAIAALFIRRSRAAPRPAAAADPGAVKALLDAEARRTPDAERKPQAEREP